MYHPLGITRYKRNTHHNGRKITNMTTIIIYSVLRILIFSKIWSQGSIMYHKLYIHLLPWYMIAVIPLNPFCTMGCLYVRTQTWQALFYNAVHYTCTFVMRSRHHSKSRRVDCNCLHKSAEISFYLGNVFLEKIYMNIQHITIKFKWKNDICEPFKSMILTVIICA